MKPKLNPCFASRTSDRLPKIHPKLSITLRTDPLVYPNVVRSNLRCDRRRVLGNDSAARFESFRAQKREPPGAMLRYDGRLTTPSACPHIVRLSWLSYFWRSASLRSAIFLLIWSGQLSPSSTLRVRMGEMQRRESGRGDKYSLVRELDAVPTP